MIPIMKAKLNMALDVLNFMDFVFVHLEAPDEMGHEGNAEGKIQAIEFFDEKIVGPILNKIGSFGDYRHSCFKRSSDAAGSKNSCQRSQSFCGFIFPKRRKQSGRFTL